MALWPQLGNIFLGQVGRQERERWERTVRAAHYYLDRGALKRTRESCESYVRIADAIPSALNDVMRKRDAADKLLGDEWIEALLALARPSRKAYSRSLLRGDASVGTSLRPSMRIWYSRAREGLARRTWRHSGCGRSFRSAAFRAFCSPCGRRGRRGCRLLLALLCSSHQLAENARRRAETARGLQALERLPARELRPVGALLHGRILPRGLQWNRGSGAARPRAFLHESAAF
jgi:hypothetical protein